MGCAVPSKVAQGCCFADVGGHIARAPAKLKAALAAARKDAAASHLLQPQLFEVDHVFGGHNISGRCHCQCNE